jgi:hypothetical protein
MNASFTTKYLAPALLMLALFAAPTNPAAAATTASTPAPCFTGAISESNGAYIKLWSGPTYVPFPGTSGRTMMWLPNDKVTVCRIGGTSYQITNTSRKNQTVKVFQKF